MNDKTDKIIIKVLIENDQIFSDEFNLNQKVQVIINKTIAQLKINAEGRELRHEDGIPIINFNQKISEVEITNAETLRFFKKSAKPDRDKGFAK